MFNNVVMSEGGPMLKRYLPRNNKKRFLTLYYMARIAGWTDFHAKKTAIIRAKT